MLSDEERGPLAAWAYNARDRLDLSLEQVIERLPTRYNPATLRKAEARSEKMSRKLYRELRDLYAVEARHRNVILDSAPPFGTIPDTLNAGVIEAIDRLVVELRADREARVEWERGLVEGLQGLARAVEQSAGRAFGTRVGSQP